MAEEERKPTFLRNSKVQLRPECSEVYVKAWAGSIGFVRDSKFDEYDFEQVLIEWEKDWRYDRSALPPTGWTYASHFILKEPPGPTPKPSRRKKVVLPPDPELEAYIAEMQKGIEAITGSEGFALFVARRVPTDQPGHSMIIPEVYADAHTGEADAVLGIAMQEHLSGVFQDLTFMILDIYGDDVDGPDEEG